MSRDRETTPEMYSLHVQKNTVRKIRGHLIAIVISLVMGATSAGGVAYVASEQSEIQEQSQGAAVRAGTVDRKLVTVDIEKDAAYRAGTVKDVEHDERIVSLSQRFNDLRDYCIATRSTSTAARRREPPPPIEVKKPKPIPPTPEAAIQKPIAAADAGPEEP